MYIHELLCPWGDMYIHGLLCQWGDMYIHELLCQWGDMYIHGVLYQWGDMYIHGQLCQWGSMYIHGLLCQWVSTIYIQLSLFVTYKTVIIMIFISSKRTFLAMILPTDNDHWVLYNNHLTHTISVRGSKHWVSIRIE